MASDVALPREVSLDLRGAEQLLRAQATVDIQTAGRILSYGRDAAYRAAKDGSLPTIKLGGRRRVPSLHLLRLLGFEAAEARTA